MHVPTGKWIDAHPSLCNKEIGLGGFANDAQNHIQRKSRPKEVNMEYLTEVGYNTYFWHLPGEEKAFLMAFRDIKGGEEILVDYGDQFWNIFEKRDEEVPKEEKEKEETTFKEQDSKQDENE